MHIDTLKLPAFIIRSPFRHTVSLRLTPSTDVPFIAHLNGSSITERVKQNHSLTELIYLEALRINIRPLLFDFPTTSPYRQVLAPVLLRNRILVDTSSTFALRETQRNGDSLTLRQSFFLAKFHCLSAKRTSLKKAQIQKDKSLCRIKLSAAFTKPSLTRSSTARESISRKAVLKSRS